MARWKAMTAILSTTILAGACEADPPAEVTTKQPAALGWDGTTSLMCGDGDVVTVERVTARLPGDVAVIAKGTCQLTLVDCVVEAGIAIQAVGGAQVTVQGGTLSGSEAAIDARDRADVQTFGVEIRGQRRATSTARLREKAQR